MSEPLRADPDANAPTGAGDSSTRAGFTQVANAFISGPLAPDLKATAIVLLSYAWGDDRAFPSQETLARDLARSVDYVQRNLAKLAALGIIKVVRRGRKSNAYVLNRDAADLRCLAESMPQNRGVVDAAKARRRAGIETAGLRHDKDTTFKTQQLQDVGAPAPAVVAQIEKELREIGAHPKRAEQVAAGVKDADAPRALAWIAAAPWLRGKKDNVPAYVCSGIQNGWEPPITGRQPGPAETQPAGAAEREAAAKQDADRLADELRRVAFSALPASIREDLERRAMLETPAWLQSSTPSQARVLAQAAVIAEREGLLHELGDGTREVGAAADPPLYGAKCEVGGAG